MKLVGPWGNGDPDTSGRRIAARGSGAIAVLADALCNAAAGKGGAMVPGVGAADLRALGSALRRIAHHEDARHVFGQKGKHGRQPSRDVKVAVAVKYWAARVAGHDDAGAVRIAGQRNTGRDLKASTVRQYAKRYADIAFDLLPHYRLLKHVAREELDARIRKFKARRERGTKQGNWDATLPE